MDKTLIIAVVGPCSAGKTTLIAGLKEQGYSATHIAQEHSYVPDLWRQLAKVDVLVFIDVSYEISMHRRRLDMTLEEFEEQKRRLNHAMRHANIYLNTDDLTRSQVLEKVVEYLDSILQKSG